MILLICCEQNVIPLQISLRISKTLSICSAWRRCARWCWDVEWDFCHWIHHRMWPNWQRPWKCCSLRNVTHPMDSHCGNMWQRKRIGILSKPKTPFTSKLRSFIYAESYVIQSREEKKKKTRKQNMVKIHFIFVASFRKLSIRRWMSRKPNSATTKVWTACFGVFYVKKIWIFATKNRQWSILLRPALRHWPTHWFLCSAM